MDKNEFLAVVLGLILILSTLVFAAGGGGGGGGSSGSSNVVTKETTVTSSDDQKTQQASTSFKNCNGFSLRVERIKCRLEQKGLDATVGYEESCRNLPDPQNCQSLYNKVASCYNFNGIQKDQCFKRVAGFLGKGNIKSEGANNKGALRNYAVFLLYDLQERVEKANEAGSINSQQAADIIDLIVQIKQQIFANKTKAEVKPLIEQLKLKWRDLGLK